MPIETECVRSDCVASPPTRSFDPNAPAPSFDLVDDSPWQFRKGEVFAGRFTIVNRLGRGGMGEVYHARDAKLSRDVAIKTLLPQWARDRALLKRFWRESQAVGQLKHPNICPIHDVGEWEGRPFLVMELVEGTSLESYLKARTRPFDPSKAAKLVKVIAMALQAAHDASIVHRDLKPDNIMLNRQGRPIVMDFGLAKTADSTEIEHLTSAGVMMGTAPYMPIEQFRDASTVDHRGDIYSLGVAFYRLLAGQLPHPGRTLEAVLAALIEGKTSPPSAHRPELDGRLDLIVMKAMARDAADRFGSMTELARAIDGYLRDQGGWIPARRVHLPSIQQEPARPDASRSIDSLRDLLSSPPGPEKVAAPPSPLKRMHPRPEVAAGENVEFLPRSGE